MSAAADALGAALADAAASNDELKRRAWASVTALQTHVAADNGAKVTAAIQALAPLLQDWSNEHQLTPGEAALALSRWVDGVLLPLPGMTKQLARAIAIELAGTVRE